MNVCGGLAAVDRENVGRFRRRWRLKDYSIQSVRIASGARRQAASRVAPPLIWTFATSRSQRALKGAIAMAIPGGRQSRPGAAVVAAAAAKARRRDPTKRQRLRLPDVPRTRVYATLSLMLLVVLGGVFIWDLIQLAARQHPDATTQHFSVAVVVCIVNWRQPLYE